MVDVMEMGTTAVVPVSPIRGLLAELAQVKHKLDEYAPILDALSDREKELRAAIQDEMTDTATERVRDFGLVVTRATRTTSQVGDMREISDFLEERDVLGQYTTIDTSRVIKDFGTDVPGVRVLTTEYITVKADTKKEAK